MTLPQPAQAFLDRTIPKDLKYVPNSISERFIRGYATSGKVELDSEFAELMQICMIEAQADSEKGSKARRA